LPKKRCRRGKGKVKHFPKDDPRKSCNLTAFIGFKAGMTHVIRRMKFGSSNLEKERCDPVTIIETPPIIVVGVVGYIITSRGLRTMYTVFAEHLSEEVRRRFYKKWYSCKAKAFSKYINKYKNNNRAIEADLSDIKKHCNVVRVLCQTQVKKIASLHQKKAQLMEIQVNGGSITDKVDFAFSSFEKSIAVDAIFQPNQTIDVIGITKGKGTKGVISRFGVTRLPRKTHRGIRKVACVGAWHPSAVKWTVARAGQSGYHHRTEMNKKIFHIGKMLQDSHKAHTNYDKTEKVITPLGGFPHYGVVKEDYIILKGSVPGPVRRTITLRQSVFPTTTQSELNKITLKFIDTSSKFGHGRFQTSGEKASTIMRKIKTPKKNN
jgi:large subunit ribosomal protein L3e